VSPARGAATGAVRLLPLALLLAASACRDDPGALPDTGGDADAGTDVSGDAVPDVPEDALDASPDEAGATDDGATPLPRVAILAPEDGALVENPVAFRIEAEHVASVRLFADDWPLGDPWNPGDRDTATYTFSGVGFERHIELFGYDDAGGDVAYDDIRITVDAGGDPGTPIGLMWNTYYYLASEADYPGAADTVLYDSSCRAIATVPAAFSDSVCVEGSGRLRDGRVINYASTCSCGRRCPVGGATICYSALDPARFPWGMGSRSNPLEPLRSWAVDTSFIPFGTVLYAEQFDGISIPSVDGLGGFVHDGCFRADDVGGAIAGNHFDFFAGTAGMWRELERVFPTGSDFSVFRDGDRCGHLRP
jgi:3D (Asp-Asp-Asp) domain-containing protein